LRGILDAGGVEILEMKRELTSVKKTLALRCSEMESKEGVVKRLNLELKKHAVKKEEQAHRDQEEGQFNQVAEALEVKHGQLEKSCEEGESLKEKEEFYISQCKQYEAEVKVLQEKMKETAKLFQAKNEQLVHCKDQEGTFIQEIKKLKAMIHGEERTLQKLERAEEIVERQRRRLQLKDQEILGYQRKLELALFVPQMGGAFPQGEAWDLSLPRVKSEYQEPEQRCGGMKRKHGESSQGEEIAATSPAMDFSNTSMSTSSREERCVAIKREEQSSSWDFNPAVDISNSSMSSSSVSKEEHSFDEKALAIKREGDA